MPWRQKAHHDWGYLAYNYDNDNLSDYTAYTIDGTIVGSALTSVSNILRLTQSSQGDTVMSDGYKAGDLTLDGNTNLSDVLEAIKYVANANKYGNNNSTNPTKVHLNVVMQELPIWNTAFGNLPEEYLTSTGGMVHRWSDLGEVTGQTSSNIRAGAARDTGFDSYNGQTGGFPKTGTISTADWTHVCPNFVPLDIAKGNLSASASWLKRAAWGGAQRVKNKRGYFLWLFKNGSGVHYRGDYQLGSIRYKTLDSEKVNLDDYRYWDFQTDSESFEGSVFQYNAGFGDVLNAIKNGTNTWLAVATGTTNVRWNRDSGGTGSSSTGLSTAPPQWPAQSATDSGSAASNYYIYAETSGSNTDNYVYALKSPMVYLGSQSAAAINWHEGRYGDNISESRVYWVTVPLMLDQGVINTTNNSAQQYRWIFGTGHPSNESTSNTQVRGKYGRFVLAYVTGTSFTGDLQLNDFFYNASNGTSGGTSLEIGSNDEWKQGDILYSVGSSYTATASDIFTKYYDQTTWSSLGTSTNGGNWVKRTNGSGTPSSGTGVSTVGTETNFTYFESTNPGFSYKMRLLRSPPFIWDSANVYARWRQGQSGATMGAFKMFFLVGDGI